MATVTHTHEDWLTLARNVLETEIEGIQHVRDALDSGFTSAVELILRRLGTGGKIVVTGVGKNLHIAQKISATLASTGSTSVMLSPTQAMHGDLGILCEGDVLLALSYSGESEELVSLLPIVRRAGTSIIAVTGYPESSLAKHSDVVVPATVGREACPFNMAPTSSTTATLALGDALAMVLLQARGFQRKDYARLHPGGAIGRALLLRVADIMRSGDRVACVAANAKVKDALLAMTRARSGSAAILDEDRRLIGIFTDGDLRRHLPDRADLLDVTVRDVMTHSPITVGPDQLAVEVLNIFEEHNIDDLLVVNASGEVAGAVDIQDLPKLKVM